MNGNESGRGQPHSKTQAWTPVRRVSEGFGVRLSSAAFLYAFSLALRRSLASFDFPYVGCYEG